MSKSLHKMSIVVGDGCGVDCCQRPVAGAGEKSMMMHHDARNMAKTVQ